jgi:hypothetical protein
VVLGIASPTALMPLGSHLDVARAVDQNQQTRQLDLGTQQQQQQQQGTPATGSALALSASSTSLSSSTAGAAAAAAAAGGAAGGGGPAADAPAGDAGAGSSTPAAAAAGAGGGASSAVGDAAAAPKQQQLVSPTAMPVPRMSNAFARKHGLDPKENPLVNLQRLAMQQQSPQQHMVRGLRGCGAVWWHAWCITGVPHVHQRGTDSG